MGEAELLCQRNSLELQHKPYGVYSVPSSSQSGTSNSLTEPGSDKLAAPEALAKRQRRGSPPKARRWFVATRTKLRQCLNK